MFQIALVLHACVCFFFFFGLVTLHAAVLDIAEENTLKLEDFFFLISCRDQHVSGAATSGFYNFNISTSILSNIRYKLRTIAKKF